MPINRKIAYSIALAGAVVALVLVLVPFSYASGRNTVSCGAPIVSARETYAVDPALRDMTGYELAPDPGHPADIQPSGCSLAAVDRLELAAVVIVTGVLLAVAAAVIWRPAPAHEAT